MRSSSRHHQACPQRLSLANTSVRWPSFRLRVITELQTCLNFGQEQRDGIKSTFVSQTKGKRLRLFPSYTQKVI